MEEIRFMRNKNNSLPKGFHVEIRDWDVVNFHRSGSDVGVDGLHSS